MLNTEHQKTKYWLLSFYSVFFFVCLKSEFRSQLIRIHILVHIQMGPSIDIAPHGDPRGHMGQYQLLSVLAARLSPLNIDHSGNLPVEICGINYTEKYTNL